jgi:hypothetical protein
MSVLAAQCNQRQQGQDGGEWNMFTGNASNRGQVLIIFVFVIIGLIGLTGLAIDGGDIYQDRRGAQNAADAAALAAAVYKNGQQQQGVSGCSDLTSACGLLVKFTAVQMAGENRYPNDIVNHTVEVHIPPIDGAYSNCGSLAYNCNDYIQVIINTNVNTYFARVLGIGQLHNRVEAVALSKYSAAVPLYSGDALVILAPHAVNGKSGEFVTNGNSSIALYGGGVFINSDGPSSFTEQAGCVTFQLNGQTITGLGGQKTGSCPTAPVLQHTSTGLQFPPNTLIQEPAECGQTPKTDTTDPDGYDHLYPGHYSSMPPSKNTRLDPGVYCIDSLIKTTNPNSNFVGSGVFLYIRPDGNFSFQGGTVNLTAPTSGSYANMLIYVASDYQGQEPGCDINGGSGITLTGVIYAPYCDVVLDGSSSSIGLTAQLVAYTIYIKGSGGLTFTYDDKHPFIIPEIDETGLFH